MPLDAGDLPDPGEAGERAADPGAAMFERATGTADDRHRQFFGSTVELRQVWARRSDGQLFYLAASGVDEQVRADARTGRLTCPYPGCPDPRFIARGGPERRHHFAHKVAGAEHDTAAGWRYQALLMLADWCQRRHPQIDVELNQHEGSLRLRSSHSGKVACLAVTYDPGHQPTWDRQVLLGHSRKLLLPRETVDGAPERWWCGEGRLVGELIAEQGWALSINPEDRLIATLVDGDIARTAGLVHRHSRHPLLCIVDELDHVRLTADGLHTPASDAIDKELARREAAEEQRRLVEEAAAAELRRRAATARAAAERSATEPSRSEAPVLQPWLARLPLQQDAQHGFATPIPARVSAPRSAADPREEDWPHDLEALRRLLGDDDLAQQLDQSLSTDVECGLPAAVWHLMAVLEFRKREYAAHPLLIRAVLTGNGCSVLLTGEAVAGVLDVARAAE
jgi:hypothetical protein